MNATIKKVIQETPRIRTYVVEPAEPVTFQTGQAMRWDHPDVKIGRLYSIASPGGQNQIELMFTIRLLKDGKFTSHLFDLKEGDTIELKGPFGKFIFDGDNGQDIALIAGGSGISVLRSIARHVMDHNLPNKVHLVFSVLNIDEIIYHDELNELAAQHPNFTYSVIVTEPHPSWKGRTGFVSPQMMDEDFGDYHQVFYICGPEAFIECVRDILKNNNVPEERIKIDRWTFYKTSK